MDIYYSATWLGASRGFYEISPFVKGYLPIVDFIYSSYRLLGQFAGGDLPFYSIPYLQMRGVPALRYQGENTLLLESEWMFNVYKNWYILGFAGTGKAFNTFEDFGQEILVYNYGTGFRLGLPKIMGLRVGFDYDWSNQDQAWYIIIGNSF